MTIHYSENAKEEIGQYFERYQVLDNYRTDLPQRAGIYNTIAQVLRNLDDYLDQTYVHDDKNYIVVENIATIEYVENCKEEILVNNIYFNDTSNNLRKHYLKRKFRSVGKYLCAVTLLIINYQLSIVHCNAQDSKSFLHSFVTKMSAQPVSFDFTFTYENLAQDKKETHNGTALCHGAQFSVLTGVTDVYCDGDTKWIYHVAAEEVMIFPAAEAHDITDNPLQYIQLHINEFKYKPKVQHLTDKEKKLLHVELFPQDKKAVYIAVGLTVEADTYYPVRIQYKLKDGQRYIIAVNSFNDKVLTKDSDFTFPLAKYPGVEVVDLRKK